MAHLRVFDHLSLWEIAHRWHDIDPASTPPDHVPLAVKDTLRALTYALSHDQFHVLSSTGTEYDNYNDLPQCYEYIERNNHADSASAESQDGGEADELELDRLHEDYAQLVESGLRRHNDVLSELTQCTDDGNFEQAPFEATHLSRREVLGYCLEEGLEPPSFWFTADEIKEAKRTHESGDAGTKPTGRHADTYLDRALWRAIAQTLWHIDPDLTIADIVKHPAIQIYGNGRLYTGRDTIRKQIKDLDPRPNGKQGGRPRKKPPKNLEPSES